MNALLNDATHILNRRSGGSNSMVQQILGYNVRILDDPESQSTVPINRNRGRGSGRTRSNVCTIYRGIPVKGTLDTGIMDIVVTNQEGIVELQIETATTTNGRKVSVHVLGMNENEPPLPPPPPPPPYYTTSSSRGRQTQPPPQQQQQRGPVPNYPGEGGPVPFYQRPRPPSQEDDQYYYGPSTKSRFGMNDENVLDVQAEEITDGTDDEEEEEERENDNDNNRNDQF